MAVERSGNAPVTPGRDGAGMSRSADDPGPEIGLTGARFGGTSRRRRPRSAEPPAPDPAPVAPPEPGPPGGGPDPGDDVDDAPVGLTGARFGGAARRRRESRPAPAVPAVPAPPLPAAPAPAPFVASLPALHDPGPPPEPSRYTIVRPYVLTGGRTRGHVDFAVEALVTTVPRPGRQGEPVEHARIRDLCRSPRSVAEISALLHLPLGVARVLLADLLAAGAVSVHRTADAGGPDLVLMERVLAGLRRL